MIGRGKVDSIIKYNAIGFDMDHALLRYKLKPFGKLLYQANATYLISFLNYP